MPPEDEVEEHWEDEGRADENGRVPLNSYSDAGVDVVVWWRFADGRAGSPVGFAQCTVQIEWSDKVSDIDVELWGQVDRLRHSAAANGAGYPLCRESSFRTMGRSHGQCGSLSTGFDCSSC